MLFLILADFIFGFLVFWFFGFLVLEFREGKEGKWERKRKEVRKWESEKKKRKEKRKKRKKEKKERKRDKTVCLITWKRVEETGSRRFNQLCSKASRMDNLFFGSNCKRELTNLFASGVTFLQSSSLKENVLFILFYLFYFIFLF